MTEMNKMKLPYIAPVAHWVWIGMDKNIAYDVGGVGGGSKFGEGIDDPYARDEGDLNDDMWSESDASWANSGGVWDKAW